MDLRPRISSSLRGMRGVLRTFTPAESYWVVGIAATPADGIATGAIGTALMLVVIAWLLIGEPLWGRMSHRRFMAQLAAGVPRARERFYAMWSTMLWALAGVVLLIAALTPGIGLARIGFRWPDLRFDIGGTSSLVAGMVVGAIGGAVAAIIASRRQKPDSNSGGAAAVPAGEAVLAMLPRTPAERRGFAVLSVTAGITEEIVWRGFLIAALVALLPPLSTIALAVVSGAVFGLAHLYQGRIGMLVTCILGVVLALLYLGTASLLLPVVLHALLDLRALLIHVDGR